MQCWFQNSWFSWENPMFGKIFVCEILTELLLVNQIAGFFKLEYLLKYMWCQSDFLHVERHLLGYKLIMVFQLVKSCFGQGQKFPGMPKVSQNWNVFISQQWVELLFWFFLHFVKVLWELLIYCHIIGIYKTSISYCFGFMHEIKVFLELWINCFI